MAAPAENIIELGRISLILPAGDREFCNTLLHLRAVLPGEADTRHIAFDIGEKDRYSEVGKRFRHDFQRNRFTCSRSAGNEAVPVGH